MHKYLVFVALLGINRLVQSSPQSFSQSFSSSSVVKPSGEVAASSIYIDSQGNKVVNGVDVPTNPGSPPSLPAYAALYNFLIPPGDPNGSPYIIETDEQQTPPPVPKPPSYRKTSTVATTISPTEAPTVAQTTRLTQAPTTQTTQAPTTRTTQAPTTRTTQAPTTRTTQAPTTRITVPLVTRSSTSRPIPSVATQISTPRPTSSLFTGTTYKKPLISNQKTGNKKDGSYVHDNSGQYKPDNRGKYRGN